MVLKPHLHLVLHSFKIKQKKQLNRNMALIMFLDYLNLEILENIGNTVL